MIPANVFVLMGNIVHMANFSVLGTWQIILWKLVFLLCTLQKTMKSVSSLLHACLQVPL